MFDLSSPWDQKRANNAFYIRFLIFLLSAGGRGRKFRRLPKGGGEEKRAGGSPKRSLSFVVFGKKKKIYSYAPPLVVA